MLEKIISYPISIVYYILFLFWLVLFHPIQWFCLRFLGYEAHKKSVAVLNWFLVRNTHVLGTWYAFKNQELLPKNKPLIIVCNHQSLYDIPPIIWFMRAWHPKFVSKKELGKGIPSVSFNLRHGGSVLIDRKDAKQALSEIQKMGQYINKHKHSVVIFPEGTRSKTGVPKKFSENGFKTLCEHAPEALVVPIAINNSWKMQKFGQFPMGLGTKITFEIIQPIEVSKHTFQEIMAYTQGEIIKRVHSFTT